MKEFKFDEVLKSVKETADVLTLDEYKTRIKDVVDRFKYVSKIKGFLIEKFNVKPMSWGWKTPQGSFDIASASEQGLKVRDKEIPWPSIDAARMAFFLKYHLDLDEKGGQEKARICLGSAIFCKLHGLTDEAEQFLNMTRQFSTIVAKDIDGVMRFDLNLSAQPLPAGTAKPEAVGP
jgi:hypothetical protein